MKLTFCFLVNLAHPISFVPQNLRTFGSLKFFPARIQQVITLSYLTFILRCAVRRCINFFLPARFPRLLPLYCHLVDLLSYSCMQDVAATGCRKSMAPTVDTNYSYFGCSSALPSQLALCEKTPMDVNAVHEMKVNYHISLLISSKSGSNAYFVLNWLLVLF